jgi:uncharacterized membrane protein YhiD involved in acid resistance
MDNLLKITLSFIVSSILGLLISLVYRKTNRGFAYDNNLRFSLLFITLIITMIMSIIGSNIALSLGLIGSLSIIRFRTAIKSVVDMVFIFWAIAAGLGVGAEAYIIAICGTIFIGLLFVGFDRFKFLFPTNSYYILILTVQGNKDEAVLQELFNKYLKKTEVKSSNFNQGGDLEIVYNISFFKDKKTDKFIKSLQELSFVAGASLLAPDTNLYV